MGANLITGNLFSPITAAEDSDFQAGICGNVTTIMPVGSEMALSILDANTISAADGVVITKEGRRIQIDIGDTEEFTIPTGTQGVAAYYIIGFHLYTDNDTGAELCETFVEAVESSSSTITENTFRDGNTEVYVSLGMVFQDGVNLDSVTALLSVADSIESIAQALGSTDISAIGDGSVTGAISQLNADLSVFSFRLNNGKAQYSTDNGTTWNNLGGGSSNMNYVMFGGTISFDISDLDDTTSITFGCSCVEGSTTKTYGASETALISVIKTWTSAHALTLPTISSRIDITCTDNKVTIQPYNNNGHTIQYSVFINS